MSVDTRPTEPPQIPMERYPAREDIPKLPESVWHFEKPPKPAGHVPWWRRLGRRLRRPAAR